MSNWLKKQEKQVNCLRQSGSISLHNLLKYHGISWLPLFVPYFNIRNCTPPLYYFDPVSAEEQRIAKEVASILKLTVDIDTTSSEGLQNVVAALRAGAEYADVPVHNCVLVSGSLSGVAGAERIGMSCVVVRSSSTARAEFPGAKAIMDGFGGADLTISRLRQIQES